ncbi:Glycosyl transferase family 2 [Hyphomicrobiales bacterium]|nr:Glycosyl transferase family 2 [Hyphomicrobiales bacterium]CAH1699159.1 Glycosyl transferase family 2 [Hyphomicrobiales bacterium]CAI0342945.1 Glycosyl transferase family 2 [Hyphomicrobiales bacterium]
MISVIIPHLNQHDALEACLLSLDGQTLEPGQFETIVIDNGSQILPGEVVARHPGVRLVQEQRPGPGPARNMGAAIARGEILAFIDADCRADPNWLRTIEKTLTASGPGIALGGDVQIWRSQGDKLNAIEAYESVFAYRFKLYIEKHGYAGTGNLAVSRRDFEAVGPFDGIEVAEDMEWGRRARAAGLRFHYVPEMVVFHPARTTLQELYVKWDRQILHYWNAGDGKPAWRLRWFARALLVLASPVAGVVTVLRSDRIDGIAARCRAIAVMIAIRVHRAATMLSLLRGNRSVVWNR